MTLNFRLHKNSDTLQQNKHCHDDCSASARDPFSQSRRYRFIAAERDERYFANHHQANLGFIVMLLPNRPDLHHV